MDELQTLENVEAATEVALQVYEIPVLGKIALGICALAGASYLVNQTMGTVAVIKTLSAGKRKKRKHKHQDEEE